MTEERRWLDELPRESAARQLLLAGKAAQPPSGALESDWRAICAVLAAPPVAAAASTSAAPQATMGAVTPSGIVTKAAAGGLFGASVAKSFFIGVLLGLGVAGAGVMVQRLASRPPAGPPSSPGSVRARAAARGGDSFAAPPPEVAASTAPRAVSEHRGTSARSDARSGVVDAPPLPETSLSAQARELAAIKRLLDRGNAQQATRQLELSLSAGTLSALAEERDALYAQALGQGGRRVEARALARRFIDHYPKSPYLEAMRRLAAE
jgi:hypothetical protein